MTATVSSSATAKAEQALGRAELARIAIVEATDPDPYALSSRAKLAYTTYRDRFARGKGVAWPRTGTLAEAMGVSTDTARRSRDELLSKGYLEKTGLKIGKAEQVRLRRGPYGSPQRDAGSPPPSSQAAAQPAAVREVPSSEESALQALSPLTSVGEGAEAAASPRPAQAGSAAATATTRPTGWRFVVTGPSGVYRRDPEGTDRLPPGYFDPSEIPPAVDEELEPAPELTPELRAANIEQARLLLERLSGVHRRPRLPIPEGSCDDCGTETSRREQYGRFALCPTCADRRHTRL